MSLTEELTDLRQRGAESMPTRLKNALTDEIEDLTRSGVADRSRGVGDLVADFQLLDALGRSHLLSNYLANGPVVLSFYRGGWCPFCTAEMKALERALPAITNLGAVLVAISPQSPDCTEETCVDTGADFVVLSDTGNRVA